jgi:hypothetical protein
MRRGMWSIYRIGRRHFFAMICRLAARFAALRPPLQGVQSRRQQIPHSKGDELLMDQRRTAVLDLAAPIALAMVIGVSVSLALAGGALLLASGDNTQAQARAAGTPAAERP